jgi:divalent metal cation (Fe/Co/Zn/Cd) transporter
MVPTGETFGWLAFAILIASILGKLWQSAFYKNAGRYIKSQTLIATGTDSRNDVVTTVAVFLAAIFMRLATFDIDGIVGLAVSLFVIYSGIRLIMDMASPLLGVMPNEETVNKIRKKIMSYDGILGLHDLVIHSYGYGTVFASVHAEVANTAGLVESHDIMDNIERDFLEELEIQLVIHTDPVIVDDIEVSAMRYKIKEITKQIDEKLSIHDFRMVKGVTHTNLVFDVVVPVKFQMSFEEIEKLFAKRVSEMDKTYFVVITFDRGYILN